jgi:hypothetical protein
LNPFENNAKSVLIVDLQTNTYEEGCKLPVHQVKLADRVTPDVLVLTVNEVSQVNKDRLVNRQKQENVENQEKREKGDIVSVVPQDFLVLKVKKWHNQLYLNSQSRCNNIYDLAPDKFINIIA